MSALLPEELLKRAREAHAQNRPDEARRDAESAILNCQKTGSQWRISVGALRVLARVEKDEKFPEKAVQHYEEAVAICRQEGDVLLLAHTVRHLADLCRDLGLFQSAKSSYVESLGLYRNHKNAPALDLANAVRGYAVLNDAMGAVAEARTLWQEALSLYSELGVIQGVTECNSRLARLRPA